MIGAFLLSGAELLNKAVGVSSWVGTVGDRHRLELTANEPDCQRREECPLQERCQSYTDDRQSGHGVGNISSPRQNAWIEWQNVQSLP
jgi:hypothetical protein